MRNWISTLLLTLLVTQFLPIKEVGKLLFQSQIVEDLSVDRSAEQDLVKKSGQCPVLEYFAHDQLQALYFKKQSLEFLYREARLADPYLERQTPPPNFLA